MWPLQAHNPVLNLALPLTSAVTLSKLITSQGLSFLICKVGEIKMVSTS